MKSSLLCVLGLLALFHLVASYTVTGEVKNEWPDEMDLLEVKLTSGTWTQKALAVINGGSSAYVKNIFEASGDNGVEGYVTYQSTNKYGHATLSFKNGPSGQNYTIDVGPVPYIGGMGDIQNGVDAVADYWVHQMCKQGVTGPCLTRKQARRHT